MKRILPIIVCAIFIFTVLFPPKAVFAQAPPQMNQAPAPTGTQWVVDPEVTFIGKNAARAGLLLDWTLQNYNWVCVKQLVSRTAKGDVGVYCDDSNNPLAHFWLTIVEYIVVPLLFFVILATAAVIIITRGRSLTIMRFIPRFIAVVLLIVFSYAILQFLYQFFDLIEGFFLRSGTASCPPYCISQKDLLYVGWNYTQFVGLRLLGDYNAESAFISLLLTKLTALTYFVMVFILILRKIILWLFIIVSPIFPLLLLYYPTRNTGKIWIGEFFRWLLYAPLFAMFLQGLVYMWRNQIPLVFTNPAIGQASGIIFPTAVNILLGGPRQPVTPQNSVNLTETFALYLVALIMLWAVILLPWILLQIFLDYASNFAPGDSAVMKTLVNMATNKQPPPAGGGGSSPAPTGNAINIPYTKKSFHIPAAFQPGGAAKELTINNQAASATTINQPNMTSTFATPAYMPSATVNAQVLSMANVSMPTMRDIAKFETALMSNDTTKQQEVSQLRSTLERIANPVAVTNTADREKYQEIRESLGQQAQQGNVLAASILNAAQSSISSASTASNSDVKNFLQQIANPASSVDRERVSQIHDMLQKESSENNNQLATSILSVSEKTTESEIEKIRETLAQAMQQGNSVASSVYSHVNNAAQQQQTTTNIRNVLSQIANPALSQSATQRESMSKLHDTLERESKENNNQLATSILSVTDRTTVSELEKIRESLNTSKDNSVASAVNTLVQQSSATTRVKSVLQQVANPASAVSPVDREKLTKLNQSLTKASQEGNELATSILSVSTKTSTADIEKLHDRIMQAKEKGDNLANQVAEATRTNTNLPAINRVQTVSNEDYLAVKDMWKQNYHNLDIPQGMAGSRSEWIKDDISKIDQIVGQLSSTDQEQVAAGMQEVSNILPFLLVGGFSQTEIVSYLKAKQEAAKEVSVELTKDEEEKVSVSAQHVEAQAVMHATVDTGASSSSVGSVTPNIETTNIVTPQVSNEILAMVNLKLPRMTDVARYETRSMTKDVSKVADVQKMHEMLEKIATPSSITAGPERERIEQLREKLVEESNKGNMTAEVILNAASSIGKTQAPVSTAQVRTVLQQIANPSLSTSEIRKKNLSELHDKLSQASQQGNDVAAAILAVKDTTSIEDVEKLNKRLQEAKGKGDSMASEVLAQMPKTVGVPSVNRLQNVSPEEYAEVKDMWKQNYHNLDIPQGMAGSRSEWIKDDISKIDQIVGQLSSTDQEQVAAGMQEVSNILPFLLVGGFSQTEIVSYLKAKQEAAKEVSVELTKDEEEKVSVSTQHVEAQAVMHATVDTASTGSVGSITPNIETTNIVTPQVSNEILAMVNLKLPRMVDIARYEAGFVSKDATKTAEATKVRDVLEKIANPGPISIGTEREQYEKLRERLVEESQKGNATADLILAASVNAFQKSTDLPQTPAEVKTVLQQIANPGILPSEEDKVVYTQLHDELDREIKENNNELASEVLKVNENTSVADIEELSTKLLKGIKDGNTIAKKVLDQLRSSVEIKRVRSVLQRIADPAQASSELDKAYLITLHDELEESAQQGDEAAKAVLQIKDTSSNSEIDKVHKKLKDAKLSGNAHAAKVLTNVAASALPNANTVQKVSKDDFDEVRKLWIENYKTLPVPQNFTNDTKGRVDWITADKIQIQKTIELLQSPDLDKREEGMKSVSEILPFLLLGGFSYQDMVQYLKVKIEAADIVLTDLQKDEENQVSIPAGEQQEKPKEMAAQVEDKKED